MAAWVKCTNALGETLFLNLDAAHRMSPLPDDEGTSVGFLGGEGETVNVDGTPEQLISKANFVGR